MRGTRLGFGELWVVQDCVYAGVVAAGSATLAVTPPVAAGSGACGRCGCALRLRVAGAVRSSGNAQLAVAGLDATRLRREHRADDALPGDWLDLRRGRASVAELRPIPGVAGPARPTRERYVVAARS